MIDNISIKREGSVFRIDLDVGLENVKAIRIVALVEQDAGDATVEVGSRRRLRQLTAQGIVTPMTAREILKVLAA